MFYALTWFAVLALLALWSLAAWAFHSIAAWTVENTGTLAGGVGTIDVSRLQEWLAPWIPSELASAVASMLSAIAPTIAALIDWLPALAGGLSVAVWVVWALGGLLLIVPGLALSGFIALLRRGSSAREGSSAAA